MTFYTYSSTSIMKLYHYIIKYNYETKRKGNCKLIYVFCISYVELISLKLINKSSHKEKLHWNFWKKYFKLI